MHQTYSEQIAAHESTRSTALAGMADVMASVDAGSTLDAEQAAKYDSHAARIKALDAHIGRLRELESLNLTAAAPVIQPAAALPSRPFVQIKSNVPPGTAFVRMACAKLMCKGNNYEAAEYAKRWDDSTPEVALALKAAVAPGTVTDATWAAPLVNQNISNDFIGLLRQATVLGKIPNLREVPFNTKVPSQTAGGTYGWVGESKPKPVTKLAFSSESLGITKVAGIVVLTQELIRLSNPKAEELVRKDMIAGIAAFLDQQFLDPAVAAVAGVNPGSITNGAATAAATTNPMADIMGLINHFVTNNISVDGVTFVMSPGNALALSFRTNLDGSPEFPGVGLNGGSYRGLTFITSGVAGGNVIAMQPDLILYADDGGVTIDASTEASLQMDSQPASPADATTVYVSLWQTNTVGLRAERFANWKRIGTNSVKYLTGVAWPAPTGGVQLAPPAQDAGRVRNGTRNGE
jgi:HK97 family phage major capsid protein